MNELSNGKKILILGSNRCNKLIDPLISCDIEHTVLDAKDNEIYKKIFLFIKLFAYLISCRTVLIVDYPGYKSFLAIILVKLTFNKCILRLRGDPWVEIENISGYIVKKIRSVVVSKVIRWSDEVAVVSESLSKSIYSNLGMTGDTISLIPIPINKKFCSNDFVNNNRNKNLSDSKKIVITTVTNFDFSGKFEGLKEFLPVFEALNNTKKYDLEWQIAGAGKYYDEFKKITKQDVYKQKIKCLGYVGDVISFYKQADFNVYYSREDAFPNALVEPMALGCSVAIINDYEPLMEIVKDNENGFVLYSSEIEASISKMEMIISGSFNNETIIRKAKKMVCEKCDIKAIGKSLAELIYKVSAQNKKV